MHALESLSHDQKWHIRAGPIPVFTEITCALGSTYCSVNAFIFTAAISHCRLEISIRRIAPASRDLIEVIVVDLAVGLKLRIDFISLIAGNIDSILLKESRKLFPGVNRTSHSSLFQ